MVRDFQQVAWDGATEAECRRIIRAAVLEDLDRGYDWTTVALVDAHAAGGAMVMARQDGVIAGLPAAALVADEMDPALLFEARTSDGALVTRGQAIAMVRGPARSLLAAERLMLNLLGRLSGIATEAHRYVEAVAGTVARIYDTRKTTPGWRRLEKYAVRQGGGHNHRLGLFDAILIKDNHLAFMQEQYQRDAAADGVIPSDPAVAVAADAVRRSRTFLGEAFGDKPESQMIIEVEVDSLAQLEGVIEQHPDIVLLDNMTADQLRSAVEIRNRRAPNIELEASGGITLATVRKVAETGVDRISVGAMTHSAATLDVGLDWQ